MFRDNDTPVRGRYYRVRHDSQGIPLAPFYDGAHIFDSPRWWDTNWEHVPPALGQIIGDKTAWNPGDPPVLRPLNITVGSPQCIAEGEDYASGLRLDSPDRFGSYPVACLNANALNDWGRWADVYVCRVQQFWVTRLLQMDGGQIDAMLDALVNTFEGAACRWDAGQLFLPPCFTVVHPRYSIAGIEATSNAEQALVEIIEGVLGPVDVGGFSTADLWYRQAVRVLSVLDAQGADAGAPILFVGHSYGGAAACVCAAMCRLARPNRIIRFLTFGAPRPGDLRLRQLCDLPTRGLAMVNQGDLVGSTPPDLADLLPVQAVLGVDLTNFDRWFPVSETWTQNADGTVLPNQFPSVATADLVDLITHVWTHGTFFGYPAHALLEYRIRIFLRCAGDLAAVGAVQVGGGFPDARVHLATVPVSFSPLYLQGLELSLDRLTLAPALPAGSLDLATPAILNPLQLVHLEASFELQTPLALSDGGLQIKVGKVGMESALRNNRGRIHLRGATPPSKPNLGLVDPPWVNFYPSALDMPYNSLVCARVPINNLGRWFRMPMPTVPFHVSLNYITPGHNVDVFIWFGDASPFEFGPFALSEFHLCLDFTPPAKTFMWIALYSQFVVAGVQFIVADGAC